jgi:hypothetical protein
MSDQPEIDFERVDQAASDPHGEREHLRIMVQIDKRFQIQVLAIFVLSTLVLLLLDILYARIVGDSIFLKTMAVITPIFTLVLGIGTNVRSS